MGNNNLRWLTGEHVGRKVFSVPSRRTYHSEYLLRDLESLLKVLQTEVLVPEWQVRPIRYPQRPGRIHNSTVGLDVALGIISDHLSAEYPMLAGRKATNDRALMPTDETETSLVDRVYRSLKVGIVNGTYPPDTPLRLQAIAETSGVSLIPVREALRLLERDLLVVSTPNKGARVASISMESLIDLYRIRKIVESEALLLAAPNLSAHSLSELRSLAMEMVGLFANDDKVEYLKTHRQFHLDIYEKCGSNWIIHIIEVLWGHADRYIHLAVSHQQSADDALLGHLQILDKLGCGDFEGACSALKDDLDSTIQRVQTALAVTRLEHI